MLLIKHLVCIRLFCSLQCYQSGLWSTIQNQPLNKYRIAPPSAPHHFFPYFAIIFTPISNIVQYLERVKSNHLPVDIPTVKGKWPYRYVFDLPLRYVKAIENGFAMQCATIAVEGATYRSK
ncbi:hypothetical protein T07_6808 [Trichinella nelsoni]|uniref:Uncharacterized protein n=1 Tax=Trichinella nelsoni TaxID=6336 RepID=A0A0V0RQ68_9BILA|nr:hypothetical protein T07_6808 [Trichinella nelsoni]